MAGAALFLSFVSAAAGVKSSIDAKSDAKKQRDLQKQQLAVQAKADLIRRQREERIRRARLVASGAASGATSSTAAGSLTALETNLQAQNELSAAGNTLQATQFDLQADNTINQANAQVAQSIGSFAATSLTPFGTDKKSLVERVLE